MSESGKDEVPESADPGPYGRARWKIRLVLTFFVVVLASITGEGLLRLYFPRETPLWADHPLCGRVQNPNVKRPMKGLGGMAFTYETNAFGFRGKSMKTE